MQRNTADNMIVIACDFTGVDWDERIPMIEGHRGAVLSLNALAMAIDQASPITDKVVCTMCLHEVEPPGKAWRHANPSAAANPDAAICWDCIQQADRAFAKDPDTDWDRKIAPDTRWR